MISLLLVLLIISFISNCIQHFKINYYKKLNRNWYELYTDLYDKYMHKKAKRDVEQQEGENNQVQQK